MPKKSTPENTPDKNLTDAKKGRRKCVGRPVSVWTPAFIAEVAAKLELYIEKTAIPSVAEFCAINRLSRQRLYEFEELAEPMEWLICKKEAGLERAGLRLTKDHGPRGSFIIFSLKQLGWRDKQEVEHSGSMGVTIVDDI